MPTPERPDIVELIAEGRESTNVEYKRSAPWNDLRKGIIRTVLGMANTRGGGHIVVGVAENNGTFSPTGMADTHIAGFPTEDTFRAAVNGFAQPYVEARLDNCEYKGNHFLVVSVREFGDVPVLCKKTDGKTLQAGVQYLRSKRMPETVAITDPRDQQELYGLMVEKIEAQRHAQDSATGTMTTSAIRRELRRLLTDCERRWVEEVSITQSQVFQENYFWPLNTMLTDTQRRQILADSIRDIQPAFLAPWLAIEELGLRAIDEEGPFADIAPHIFQALERAYALPTHPYVQHIHPTVVGHGQLLALRTWTIWGAYALFCENWDAVEMLLHHEANFYERGNQHPQHSAFVSYRSFYAPDAAGSSPGLGYYEPALMSTYHHSVEFAEKHFFDLGEMVAYIGLWFFACDVAIAVSSGEQVFPGWIFAPPQQLQRLLQKVSHKEYSWKFADKVAHSNPPEINKNWPSIRETLSDPLRLNGDHTSDFLALHVPEKFAE